MAVYSKCLLDYLREEETLLTKREDTNNKLVSALYHVDEAKTSDDIDKYQALVNAYRSQLVDLNTQINAIQLKIKTTILKYLER